MKHIILLSVISIISLMASSQTKIYLTVGDNTLAATLADNAATRSLISLLADGSMTIQMSDYGGFEKVGELPQSLPTSNSSITTVPGDIMLYQGNNIVIFYGSNSWSYTPIGKIDGATPDGLRQFLGTGSITLRLSITHPSGVEEIPADPLTRQPVYDLTGRPVTHYPFTPGIYIIGGKKTLIR